MTDRVYVPEVVYKNYAPFLQAQFKPVDYLVLHAGARYEHAELDIDTFQTVFGKGGVTVQGASRTLMKPCLMAARSFPRPHGSVSLPTIRKVLACPMLAVFCAVSEPPD